MDRNGIGGFTMRKKFFPVIISVLVIGIFMFTMTSCKRNKEGEPELIPNAGFRVSLSGTANPSTLYVPEAQPPRNAQISVRALHSTGEPAAGFQVIFQVGSVGYLNDFKSSIVATTDGAGMVYSTFFLPPSVNIKASVYTNVTVTLVDDGRLDNSLSVIEDVIPIHIIPYMNQGVVIHGRITTSAGNGVGGISVILDGDVGLADAVTVTRSSGSYEFFVAPGWYGTISPSSQGYTFVPPPYTFDSSTPIVSDIYNLDFVAIFAGGDTLATDVTIWDNVPITGGTQVVNVYNGTGDAPIGYIIMPNSPWVHVSPNSGTTPGRFTITVDENTTGSARNGTVTITATDTSVSSVTITINQLGGEVPSDARLAVDLETLNLPWESSAETINVYNSTTSDSISYIVTSIPENDWILVSATSGSTPSTLTITVLDNLEEARTGQVILTPTSIGVTNTVTITVNQEAGPSLALSIETKNVAVGGETFSVTVTNPTNSEAVNFTVTSNDTWLNFTPTSGNTPAGIRITVTANGTGQIRTGVVTFTGAIPNVPVTDQPTITLTITQQGS
jgi:hypothetical protein